MADLGYCLFFVVLLFKKGELEIMGLFLAPWGFNFAPPHLDIHPPIPDFGLGSLSSDVL